MLFCKEMEKKNFRNEYITGTIGKSFEKIREKDVSFIFSFPMNTADIRKLSGLILGLTPSASNFIGWRYGPCPCAEGETGCRAT